MHVCVSLVLVKNTHETAVLVCVCVLFDWCVCVCPCIGSEPQGVRTYIMQ
jgi:hypothetical protein